MLTPTPALCNPHAIGCHAYSNTTHRCTSRRVTIPHATKLVTVLPCCPHPPQTHHTTPPPSLPGSPHPSVPPLLLDVTAAPSAPRASLRPPPIHTRLV